MILWSGSQSIRSNTQAEIEQGDGRIDLIHKWYVALLFFTYSSAAVSGGEVWRVIDVRSTPLCAL